MFGEMVEQGISGAGAGWGDRLARLRSRFEAADLVWPAEVLGELIAQQESYSAHDARFDPHERFDILDRERVNVLCMAPTEYRVIAARAEPRPVASITKSADRASVRSDLKGASRSSVPPVRVRSANCTPVMRRRSSSASRRCTPISPRTKILAT